LGSWHIRSNLNVFSPGGAKGYQLENEPDRERLPCKDLRFPTPTINSQKKNDNTSSSPYEQEVASEENHHQAQASSLIKKRS